MVNIKNVEAIIFDKDGTLLDFDAFWVPFTLRAVGEVLFELGAKKELLDKILEELGVNDGTTDIDGILCKGTYEQIGEVVCKVLLSNGLEFSSKEVGEAVISAYNKKENGGEIKPTCQELSEVLEKLKKQSIRLAVVTTDNEEITKECLASLGVYEYFDKIYTDDGVLPTKPNPYCAEDFIRTYGLNRDKVLMVGDTVTDALFAGNAGIKMIGIAKSKKNKELLGLHTDTVISSLSELLEICN